MILALLASLTVFHLEYYHHQLVVVHCSDLVTQ